MRLEAHLGVGKQFPTLSALEMAGRLGASLVEFDIQLTADQRLLPFHNYTLPDGQWVHETSFHACMASLRAYSDSGETPPPLEALVESAADLGLGINLDVKSGFAQEGAPHRVLAQFLKGLKNVPEVHVSDWDHAALRGLKEMAPSVVVRGAIRGRPMTLTHAASEARLDGINLAWDCTRPSDVKSLRSAGLMVCLFGGWSARYLKTAMDWSADVVLVDDLTEALRPLQDGSQ